MKESGENKMKDFYKAMTKLVNNKHYIELLTKTKNYDEVINILKLVASADLHTVLQFYGVLFPHNSGKRSLFFLLKMV